MVPGSLQGGPLTYHRGLDVWCGPAILWPSDNFETTLSLFRGLPENRVLYNSTSFSSKSDWKKIVFFSYFTVSILGSSWHVAETVITSTYRALSKELITAELGAYVGLGHVNITLNGKQFNCYIYTFTIHVYTMRNSGFLFPQFFIHASYSQR